MTKHFDAVVAARAPSVRIRFMVGVHQWRARFVFAAGLWHSALSGRRSERQVRLSEADVPTQVVDALSARNSLSRSPHRKRSDRGSASGSEGV